MSATGEEDRVDRLRALAERVVGRIGGVPAVQTAIRTFDAYDQGGGGLVAGGLAYSALVALIPGLLLVVSVIGILVDDPAAREQLVESIAAAIPPLENLARAALDQVAAGAVPTGIIAALGLVWGASRFYAALDNAFARIFQDAPKRNEVQRMVRGLVLTGLFVILPIAALALSSITTWLLDVAPAGQEIAGGSRGLWSLASPIGSVVLFVAGTLLVFRLVPARTVPMAVCLRPAILVGLALAAFTQVFSFIAPRLLGVSALFGAFAAVFALLAWLSIGFNALLLGGAWTRVRLVAWDERQAAHTAGPSADEVGSGSGGPAAGAGADRPTG